jgi:hypothetical protein
MPSYSPQSVQPLAHVPRATATQSDVAKLTPCYEWETILLSREIKLKTLNVNSFLLNQSFGCWLFHSLWYFTHGRTVLFGWLNPFYLRREIKTQTLNVNRSKLNTTPLGCWLDRNWSSILTRNQKITKTAELREFYQITDLMNLSCGRLGIL